MLFLSLLFLPLLEPILLPTPTYRSLCSLRLPWDHWRSFPWCARQIRGYKEELFPPLHTLWWILHLWSRCWRIYLSLWVEDLMPTTMTLFLACPSSNHADGGHVEHWLGPNSIDPYKFNNRKQQLVAQENVLGPDDVFLIIQVNFDLKRKVNRDLQQTRSCRSSWQTWWCLRKGNHSHVCILELEAPFVVNKTLTVSLWVY